MHFGKDIDSSIFPTERIVTSLQKTKIMNNEDELRQKTGEISNQDECRMYGSRWFMLAIFVVYSAMNSIQWIQFSIIADVITDYYKISYNAVDWTSIIYMVLYIPFIFPASYILDKLGLRYSVLMGSIGTAIGSWIKVGAVAPDRFWLAFIGQSIVALSQIFILSVPARLAAVWFGSGQVSSACSIGVFGNQMGIAIGFLVPPLIVSSSDEESRTRELYILFGSVAAISTIVLLLVVFFFKEAPPTPPSYAQIQAQKEDESSEFIQSLKRLCTDIHYILLLISYGINVGVFYAISTLLNQIVLKYYPGASVDAGWIGLVIVLAGMVGSVICGFILDKYHKYKETNFAVYLFSLLGMIVFTFTLDKGILVVYFTSAILGFFMTGLMPIGFELAAELTFPEPEGTSAGLLNAAAQVLGIALTNLYSVTFSHLGVIWSNNIMSIFLFLGAILLYIVKPIYRRQEAQSIKKDVSLS